MEAKTVIEEKDEEEEEAGILGKGMENGKILAFAATAIFSQRKTQSIPCLMGGVGLGNDMERSSGSGRNYQTNYQQRAKEQGTCTALLDSEKSI